MRTKIFSLASLALTAFGMLSACGAGSGDEPFDRAGAALDYATSSERCGVDGRVVYDKSCAELERECSGEFICADEVAARDGSCSTWGECTTVAGGEGEGEGEGGGDGEAQAKRPTGPKYPDITLKPGAMGEAAEPEVIYGPVIKVKPKG
jgi:hypothetical protein